MAGLRSILTALALGTAIISRPAVAQHGSSSSLTHVVTVTVPPRVKVQVGKVSSSVGASVKVPASIGSVDGLAVSVSATRSWVLSIGSGSISDPRQSHVQWSLNNKSGFSTVTNNQATVASGTLSSDPRAGTMFFRNANAAGQAAAGAGGNSEPVVLTVAAP
jgi:hypothetical protein